MKIVYLDASSIGATPLDEIAALGDFTAYANSTPEQARARVKDCDVLIINKIIVNEELLSCAPKLKLICESPSRIPFACLIFTRWIYTVGVLPVRAFILR